MLRSGLSASASALWYSSLLAESLSLSKTIARVARGRPNFSTMRSLASSESLPEPSNPHPLAGHRASVRKVPPSPTLRPRTIGSAIGGGKQTGPGTRTGSAEPTLGARLLHVSIVTDAPYLIRELSGLPSFTQS